MNLNKPAGSYRPRGGARLHILAFATAMAVAVVVPTVWGHEYGADTQLSCGLAGHCNPERQDPRFNLDDNVNSNWRDDAQHVRTGELNATVINSSAVSSHGNADVYVQEGNYGNTGDAGVASCTDRSDNGFICKHWHVFFNSFYSYTQGQRRATICHEYGHTVGLRHYMNHQEPNPSCLEVNRDHSQYNAHDKDHLSNYFN